MFTCARISDVEYYLAEMDAAAEAKALQGEAALAGGPQNGGRDSAAYYLDNGAGEDKGTWWAPSNGQPVPMVSRGAEVDPRGFRALARGCDPRAGELLVQSTRKERLAGYDLQFAAPKSVSVLWATAPADVRSKMEEAHRAAVHRALDFAQGEGLIVTRRGSASKGMSTEPVADAAVAEFMHTTSRAGDPQVHSHAVLLNVCTREDGSTGTLDNARILQYQGAMGAVYRAELAASLERELGLAIYKDARNFRVDGVPQSVMEVFSKRRAAIESSAEINGYSTANDRERARLAAVATRDKKADVPGREDLERRWTREVASVGWSPASVWQAAKAARSSRDAVDDRDTSPEQQRATQRHERALAAIGALEGNEAVLERRHVVREVVERMQGIGNAEEALAEVAWLKAEGHLVELPGRDGDEDAHYATPAMVATERRLLAGALERKGEREFVPAAKVEAAIAARRTMSAEQAEAVRHALNRDGVSVVEGSAGTGKSFSLGGVADAAREAELHVYVVAPSHKAKDVIRHDTTTDEDSAKAVQGFNNRLSDPTHKDHIALHRDHCIIVDEAGMVGTREMELLLRHAQEAGAKVILAGDTRQLQPVSAGGPMGAIAKLVGTQRIEEIRRQKEQWQRAASTDFATGKADRALEAYDKAGHLHLEDTGEAALAALARDWRADVERNPEAKMEKPWEARIVVAGRNKDVKALNEVLRESYREAGRLQGDDVDAAAFSRGQNGKLETLKIAVGDRLVFGEAVTVGGVTLNNSDMGTVEKLRGGADPKVRIRLDKGETFDANWSELVGYRNDDAPASDRHPKIQHAYAVTIHASQGTTVNRAFAYNGHGMGMESAYVAMTRHREQALLYVDSSRIIDRLEAQQSGNKMRVSKGGKVDAKDAEDDEDSLRSGGITREAIAKVVLREVMKSETKRNVSDFVGEPKSWALGEREMGATPASHTPFFPTPRTEPQKRDRAVAEIEASLAALDAIVSEGAVASGRFGGKGSVQVVDNGPMQIGGSREPCEAAVKVAARIADRERGPAYPAWRISNDDAELDRFCREINLAEYIKGRGYLPNEAKSDPRARSWFLERGSDQIIATEKPGSGWTWWRVGTGRAGGSGSDRTDSGTIISYVQSEERVDLRGKLGLVRVHLRPYIGENGPTTRVDTIAQELRSPPKVQEHDFAGIRRRWNAMKAGVGEWLLKRGITPDTVSRFQNDIRLEGGAQNSNVGGVCFAHRDEAGDITGWSRKGPKRHPLDERSFSQSASGAPRLITRMGDRENPRVVYVAEKALDALSVYQLDNSPRRVLLVATEGRPSAAALDELKKLAARYPHARFGLHFDNDVPEPKLAADLSGPKPTYSLQMSEAAGRFHARQVADALRAGNPEVAIVERFPPVDYKDWNDVLRGAAIAQSEADYQMTLARCSGPAASPEDRERAAERRFKDWERAEVQRLWDAQQSGELTPEGLQLAGERIQAARDARKVERIAAETMVVPEKSFNQMEIELRNAWRELSEDQKLREAVGPQLALRKKELEDQQAALEARKAMEAQAAQEAAWARKPNFDAAYDSLSAPTYRGPRR